MDCGLGTLQDVVEEVLHLQIDTSIVIGKLRIDMTWIKQEGIATINRFIKQIDTLKGGV